MKLPWRRLLMPRILGLCSITVLAAGCVLVWAEVVAATPRGTLTFAVLNVGQGDALYIESPTGTSVLVDGGPDSSVLRALPSVMPAYARTLSAVIETHPDADHIGGLPDVLARYRVNVFIDPGLPMESAVAQALVREAQSEHVPRYIAQRNMTLDLGGGVTLEVLYPDHDVSRMPDTKNNEGAIVARLVYGKTSVLLTSDAPKDVEARLMTLETQDGVSELHSDILKVGHHGSKTSTSPQFLVNVHPSLAVISVGAHNRYGHPNKETLDTFASAGVPVVRTDEQGTLVFQSDGERWWRN